MLDEKAHTFTYTSTQAAKLSALMGMGLAILRTDRLLSLLAQAGMKEEILMAMSLFAEASPSEFLKMDDTIAAHKADAGLNEAILLAQEYYRIAVKLYAPAELQNELLHFPTK